MAQNLQNSSNLKIFLFKIEVSPQWTEYLTIPKSIHSTKQKKKALKTSKNTMKKKFHKFHELIKTEKL
jgi:hypothetical protein